MAEREGHEIRKGRVRGAEPELEERVSSLLRAAMSHSDSRSPSLSSTISSQGFHFTLSTTVHIPASDERDKCSLHLLHVLDPHVYADQYELAQRHDYTTSYWGTFDLERPVSAVDSDQAVLLVSTELSQDVIGHHTNITLDVPLHARYGRPVSSGTPYSSIDLKRPIGFLACSSAQASESSSSWFLPHNS